MKRVIIVGGGASGMLAAIAAGGTGTETVLLERNEKLGKKLYITGKGRCNVTNVREGEAFLENVIRNPRFVRSCLARFSPSDTVKLLEGAGLKTKVERGGRVFPVSDKSSDVIKALSKLLEDAGVRVMLNSRVTGVGVNGAKRFVTVNGERMECGALILGSGGVSYPSTGSTGDGYRFAEALGHTVVPLSPVLTGFTTLEAWPGTLAGLTLKNVTLACRAERLRTDVGEMLFTHDGVSGPLVLEMSSRLENPENAELTIDLKPGLTQTALDARVLRDLETHARRHMVNALEDLLPRRLIPAVLKAAGIYEAAVQLTRGMRTELVNALKGLPLTVKAPRGFNEAVVTRGGVDVKQVDPKSMQSKLVERVFFTGELLDIDALTGGFNLQLAFSTGWAAGLAAGEIVTGGS